jgi:hypothetical protein
MKMKKFQIFVFLAFLAVSMVANASQVILNPSKDAGIWELNPTTNYGGIDYAWIGYDSGWARTLMAFDLSAYTGTIVEGAFLELYVYNSWGTIPTDGWGFRVDSDWNEGTVTWDTRPGYEGTMWFWIGTPTVGDWVRFEVTNFVETWIDSSFTNYGFYLGSDDGDYGGYNFYTKEYSDPDYRPQLELNYHDVSVQPTSLGILKAIYK